MDRPFGCPSCERVIEHVRFGLNGVGCLLLLILSTLLLAALGATFPWSYMGGLVLAIMAASLVSALLHRLPTRRKLRLHVFCFEDPVGLAHWIESIMDESEWKTYPLDYQYKEFRHETLDDALGSAAIDTVDKLRSALRGDAPKEGGTPDLQALRAELRAIAKDLRAADA